MNKQRTIMKDTIHLTVWAIAWDTRSGTDCAVFGTEAQADACLAEIIREDIEHKRTPEAQQVQALLDAGLENLSGAFALWQEFLKDPLHTYSWGPQTIRVPKALLVAKPLSRTIAPHPRSRRG